MIRLLQVVTLCLLAGSIVLIAARPRPGQDDPYGSIGSFSFQGIDGKPVTDRDLSGKVCVFAAFFTCCTESCPALSGSLARLQGELASLPDLRLVSLTVDPEHDTPEKLAAYAQTFGANPNRWLFLTGPRADVESFVVGRLKQGMEENKAPDRTPGNKMLHSNYLVLVDRTGQIRGFYRGDEPEGVHSLKQAIRRLHTDGPIDRLLGPWGISSFDLPAINAALNGLAATLLLIGYWAIRKRWIGFHKTCVISAFAVSMLFLASYLYFHFVVKNGRPTEFSAQGAPRAVYFTILLSHTVLAVAVAVMAPVTLILGFGAPGNRHLRLARWTFPIWLYVSVTGVVIYWMLYRLYPSG